jgi:EAL domain-containing protein (putative c-di-GMP-specific phosphodiesterase class I)
MQPEMLVPPSRHEAPSSTLRPRILLVEDDTTVRRLFARILITAGFDVECASDGRAAAQQVIDNDYAAVVSDIGMPGMSGVELLRCMRAHGIATPVLLVTRSTDLSTAAEAVGHGAFQLLLKPVPPALLASEVRRATKVNAIAQTQRMAMRLFEADREEASRRAELDDTFTEMLGSLWMAYQPIVRSDGSVFGHEALMRSDSKALPHPGAMLDAAERLGRLRQLSRACREGAVKGFAGESSGKAALFVNLHASDLSDEVLLDPKGALASIAPRVVLEITERASLGPVKDVRQKIAELKALGFRIAIDDLGAGYAGLSTISVVEPEIVKLDMSLVRGVSENPVNKKLVRMIVAACKDLGIQTVAEGIETVDDQRALVALGCDYFQGFLIARPGRPFPVPSWPELRPMPDAAE